ncbi:T9SS type A sorting domain-containing protein [Bacteroidota bacterium]
MKTYLLLIFIMMISTITNAQIIHIPSDYSTIQQGIDAAYNGDTVLVQPGTYVENINYNGKNITVASLFLSTLDTTYISQTIIDGDSNNISVATFENGEDSTAVLCGFTITNGYSFSGGGLYCINASPTVDNVIIEGNSSEDFGGGIYCSNSNPILQNLTIQNNYAFWGGGIGCNSGSEPLIRNVTIKNNTANYGGGIGCLGSSPEINNVIIINNTATDRGGGIDYYNWSGGSLYQVIISNNTSSFGGGIYLNESSLSLTEVVLSENSGSDGGAINSRHSDIVLHDVVVQGNFAGEGGGFRMVGSGALLQNVKITNNTAEKGGGICNYVSSLVFDSINRCNIFSNNAFTGKDLYSDTELLVVVDTFTVLNPTNYYAEEIGNFEFDILHGLIQQVDADLYVSPFGDNNNSGLTEDDPLRNIGYAFSIIMVDSLNPHTIYLLNGTYSTSTNDEVFPVNILDYISLSGESESGTILDAERQSGVVFISNNTETLLSDLTITGGKGGGGISCSGSNLTLHNLTIMDNEVLLRGGGLCCYSSNVVLKQVSIYENTGGQGGGLFCMDSQLELEYSNIEENIAYGGGLGGSGGGIFVVNSIANLTNVVISGNTAEEGGGIICVSANPILTNTLIQDNSADYGGGLLSYGSNPLLLNSNIIYNNATNEGSGIYIDGGFGHPGSHVTLINTIVWGENEQGIDFDSSYSGSSIITISCSDIMGGESGINTTGGGTVNWQEGNLDKDPLFTGTGDDPYALSDNSPCIDAGTPDTVGLNLPPWDIIGNVRIWDGNGNDTAVIDMGAYEYSSLPVGLPVRQINNEELIINNYPNPFATSITIEYELSQAGFTEIKIYDQSGQMIEKSIQQKCKKGKNKYIWQATEMPTGIYLIRLKIGQNVVTKKIIKL